MLTERLHHLIPSRFLAHTAPSNIALYLVVNEEFLVPMRVLVYSLLKTGSFLHLPIVVFTDDVVVTEDPFVQQIATKVVLVTKEQKDSLNVIKANRIPSRLRREDLPKYTFLKWMMFDDLGYRTALFLDADMICLANANPLLAYAGQADLVVAPQFKDVIRFEDVEAKVRRTPDDAYQRLLDMLNGQFDTHHQNLNSGVMLMSERLLRQEFREELVAMAQQIGAMPNEQRYLTEKFSRGSHERLLVSSKYNFHDMYLNAVDPLAQFELLSKIALLHYAGPDKPWIKKTKKTSHQLWHQVLIEIQDLPEFRFAKSWPE